MERIAKIIVIISICLFNNSCKKDFLVTPPGNLLIREEYVNNLTTLSEYLNGIYVQLLRNYATATYVTYPEMAGDNIKPVVTNPTNLEYYRWNQKADEGSSSSNVNMNSLYSQLYRMISNCNFAIEKADEFKNESLSKSNDLKGQALFIRAFAHHTLVCIFAQAYNYSNGGIHPGIIYAKSFDWKHANSKRSSVAEVYKEIINDLQDAANLLPENTGNTNTISRNATFALLSRVNLYKDDYDATITFAKDVIVKVPLMINNYPDRLFTNQDSEALFQIMPNEQVSGTIAGFQFQDPPYLQYTASNDIADLLNERPGDARKKWVTRKNSNWYITKFPLGVIPGFSFPANSYFTTVLRSSELYLNLAEAYWNKGSAFEDNAREYLDMIRKRADPTATSTTATGAALLDAIYKERRKELAFESQRLFDLKRWKKSILRSDPLVPEASQLTYPDYRYVAPIPSSDVILLGIPQNTGF
ncbi:MAG TPA: RagB/SusD family nutrient uptake outer membrane protein [Pedobacter sp.]|uniref:RagB/SusD family nutrient uptake outer membrane protein n=1 Tax=Pedobacter sp. TaxID=1411316 RepID=UPI002CF7037D|nr:RagB/SusD family nutrient uptake outer membrane protein [Pedobacter sp.]HMI01783.1 RagB/SusD family nutrient uptake outer membrane protein [Pedobacter sp.]